MQVEYKTEKGTVLFVKVPDDANCFTMKFGRLCFNDIDNMPDYIVLNKYGLTPEKGQEDDEFWELASKHQEEQNRIDKFQLIGLTNEITEEQAKMMVDKLWNGYMNYELKYEPVGNYTRYVKQNALESLKSIMQKLQVYEVNPFEKPYRTSQFGIQDLPDYIYADDEEAHEFGKSRTGKWIVLFKPE